MKKLIIVKKSYSKESKLENIIIVEKSNIINLTCRNKSCRLYLSEDYQTLNWSYPNT